MGAAAILAALDAGGELEQALAVLRAAGQPEPEALEVAAGDRLLLAALEQATGAGVELTARCPACGALSCAQVTAGSVPAVRPRNAVLGGGGVRAPRYRDLAGLPADERQATDELLRRCVVGRPARAPVAADLERVDDALTGPVAMACSACGEPLAVDVDVQAAVLQLLVRAARAVEREIHLLAGAYHWTLAEIRGLPDAQRSALARLVEDER
jgi:hypothetical protein